jgi:hypothetical protein
MQAELLHATDGMGVLDVPVQTKQNNQTSVIPLHDVSITSC